MSGVGRYVKFTAQPDRRDEVAQLLLAAADSLRETAGCELYVINRAASEPDVVWVTELWLSQEALDASLGELQTDEGKARIGQVMALLAKPPELTELEPLGGVGYVPGGDGYTLVNLEDVEDMAKRFGFGDQGEARFANRPLHTARTGLSHQRPLDAVRIAPESSRAFEAGPEGLEFMVVGPHHAGDAAIDSNFWPAEVT